MWGGPSQGGGPRPRSGCPGADAGATTMQLCAVPSGLVVPGRDGGRAALCPAAGGLGLLGPAALCLGALGLALLGGAALRLLLGSALLRSLGFLLPLGSLGPAIAGGLRRVALALGGGPTVHLPGAVCLTGGRIGGGGHGTQENEGGQRPQPRAVRARDSFHRLPPFQRLSDTTTACYALSQDTPRAVVLPPASARRPHFSAACGPAGRPRFS